MMRSVCAALLFAALILAAAPGSGIAAPGSSDESVMPKNVISTNPLLDMFTWFSLEYERSIASNSTVGIAGSYVTLNDEDDSYMSYNVFYRYYPQGSAPAGFFFGGRLGGNSIVDKQEEDWLGNVEPEEKHTVFGVGIDIGYTWVLGSSKHFALSLGIGAIRFFGDDLEDVTATLPTIRLINAGIAF